MATRRMTRSGFAIVNRAALCLALVMAVMGSGVMPVTATAGDGCITVADWRAVIVKNTPNMEIGEAEPMSSVLLAFVVDRYNATPPVNRQLDPDAGYMLLARMKPMGMPFGDAAFGLFKGGCLVGTFITPLPHAKPAEPGEPI